MYFTNTIATTILAFAASSAFAAPVVERQAALQPWQVNTVSSFNPSGRPGQYPWSSIRVELTDPNEIQLGTSPDGQAVTLPAGNTALNCEAKYFTSGTPLTFGHRWPCDNDGKGEGYWYFEVNQASGSSSGNFDLKITRVAEVLFQGSSYSKTFVGTGHFEVGQNLAGSCGGSGVCSWGLKPELKPFPVQQTEVQ
jgi:hypothetical protein